MAESPALLAGYSALWDLFSKSTLTPHEQQVVYLTSNFENDCHYCMAGHSTLAKMIKVDPAVIDALRPLGINVRVPLRGVGHNLQDHISAGVLWARREPGPPTGAGRESLTGRQTSA